MKSTKTNVLFALQVVALLGGCVFAAVFNSHLKVDHPSQTVGAIGLLFTFALFIGFTLARIRLASTSRASAAKKSSVASDSATYP
jgi:FtsH-binding integral membrane protein